MLHRSASGTRGWTAGSWGAECTYGGDGYYSGEEYERDCAGGDTDRDGQRKERRQLSMLQGIVESYDQNDQVQLEYWVQVINKHLGRSIPPGRRLTHTFIDVIKESNESCWVLDIKDDLYGYYVYFINLSNKQANLTVDGRMWVKTPIFLRRSANRGIYLNLEDVPPKVATSCHIKGIEFRLRPEPRTPELSESESEEAAVSAVRGVDDGLRESGSPEPKGDCDTCIHRVDSSITDRSIACALGECEYEHVDSIRGRYTKEL